MITDHDNKWNNENVWNIIRNTQMWHAISICVRHAIAWDMQQAYAVGKMALVDLLDTGLPQTFNL